MIYFHYMKKSPGLFLLLAFILSACALGQAPQGQTKLLQDVPFFAQEDYQCGPAALATVMNYWYRHEGIGKTIGIDEIVRAIYSPTARGVLPVDIENYPKQKGFSTYQFEGSVAEIRKNIDNGVPIIILVDYGLSVYQINHFMVATGYSDNGIFFNSGRKQREHIKNSSLEKIWKKTGYWALRVTLS